MYEQFADLLRQAAPIGLQELNENRLQDRTDTKYLLHERQLLQALRNAVSEYRVLTVRAVQLSDELRQSRRRIVTAREDERRRLRRDLHDGHGRDENYTGPLLMTFEEFK